VPEMQNTSYVTSFVPNIDP